MKSRITTHKQGAAIVRETVARGDWGVLAAKLGLLVARDLQTVWKQNHVNARRPKAGVFASAHGPPLSTARHNERREVVAM
jgi:hypothetical protein